MKDGLEKQKLFEVYFALKDMKNWEPVSCQRFPVTL